MASIELGILCDTIEQQLTSQNVKFNSKEIKRIDKWNEQITGLKFAGLLTDKETDHARGKLLTKIKRAIKPIKAPYNPQ